MKFKNVIIIVKNLWFFDKYVIHTINVTILERKTAFGTYIMNSSVNKES